MIINGIQEVVYELEDIKEKSIAVERAFKEHGCDFTKWSRAVLKVVSTVDASPVPPFEVYGRRYNRFNEASPDYPEYIEGYFWDIEDAKNFIWDDTSDEDMVIKNYAENICWTPEDHFAEFNRHHLREYKEDEAPVASLLEEDDFTTDAHDRSKHTEDSGDKHLFQFNPEDIITDILNDAGEDKDDADTNHEG